MKTSEKIFLWIALAGLFLLALHLITGYNDIQLPLSYELLITGTILLLGLLFTFRKKPTPSPATPAATPTAPATPAKKKNAPLPAGWLGSLIRGILGLAMIGGIIYGIGWVFLPWLNNWATHEAAGTPETRVHVSPPGSFIGHDYPARPSARFSELAQVGTTYDVFHLDEGQEFKWDYIEAPVKFRVMGTGQEPFTLITKQVIGQKWHATSSGMLQVRSTRGNNRVKLIRLNTFNPNP
jgi:hypothetical protein